MIFVPLLLASSALSHIISLLSTCCSIAGIFGILVYKTFHINSAPTDIYFLQSSPAHILVSMSLISYTMVVLYIRDHAACKAHKIC